jgi:two-component system, NtrC family, nitrogen regulation sensor histidine kinase NtrY
MHRRFYFKLIVRVVALVAAVFCFTFVVGKPQLVVNQIIFGIVVCGIVVELIRFVNRTNRELSKLFSAIAHRDFSVTFQYGAYGKSFQELEDSLNEIILAYKAVKIDREAQYHLLQHIVNHVNIGIVVVNNNDEIPVLNPATESLLNIKGLRTWKLLREYKPSFVKLVEELGDHGRRLVEWNSGSEVKMLSIDVLTTRLVENNQKIIILQDINRELDQKEIESWHKLIRILTHEIMNSVTPISSLTETTQSMLTTRDGNPRTSADLTDENISDVVFSLSTIQRRSDGLLGFVEKYRTFTRVPTPVQMKVSVSGLFEDVKRLLQNELQQRGIRWEQEVNAMATHIHADSSLIGQVLINLIGNSIHALEGREDGVVVLRSYRNEHTTIIEVRDNGRGIPEKEMDHIFVPFFTTRKDGSGIGLSLCKQIMSLHGGTITVRSREGEGTGVYLSFRWSKGSEASVVGK